MFNFLKGFNKFKVKHLLKLDNLDGAVVDIIDENTDVFYGRVIIGKSDLHRDKFPKGVLNKVVGKVWFINETETEPLHITAYVM